MTIAKGLSSGYLPLGAVLISKHIAKAIIEEGGEFFHGMTYSGHPAACAVAKENIRILRDEKIIDQVKHYTGPYFQEKWHAFRKHPLVGEARGIGFLGALELVQNKKLRKRYDPPGRASTLCREAALDNGLIMRSVGDTVIISPPLIMNIEQIDESIEIVGKSLDDTYPKLRNPK